jgi:CTP:molybdopterin cytidylyltransferase MocA
VTFTPRFAAVVPAAGRATRFGGGKLTAAIGGHPMLSVTLASLLDAGASRVIVVVADGAAFEQIELISDPRVSILVNPDPDRGMFSSIQIGVAAIDSDVDRVLVLPGDMPFVRAATVSLIACTDQGAMQPLVPAYQGKSGHPLSIPRVLLSGVLRSESTSDLKTALQRLVGRPATIDVDDPGVLRDIDTKADLGG